jgi:glycosyltransferase involved in cell wall biosynthesis
MTVIIEASPISWAYIDPLADTGITRVCKNIIDKLDRINQGELDIYLLAQESLWNNFLLAKFVYERRFKNIKAIVDGRILPFCNEKNLNSQAQDLFFIKNALDRYEFSLENYIEPLTVNPTVFHSNYLLVPDFIRNNYMVKIIHTIHDIFPYTHPNLFHESNKKVFFDKLLDISENDQVVCVSNYTRNQLLKTLTYLSPERTYTIYNSADHYSFDEANNSSDQTSFLPEFGLETKKYLLSVSTIEPRKNFPSIIKGFIEYVNSTGDKEIKLAIVGSYGWLEKDAKNDFEKAIQSKQIIFLGRVSDSSLVNFLLHAKFFISGSFCEGFGLGALEAMFLGTPAICPSNSAQEEIVGPYGVVIKDWTPHNLAEALKKYKSQDEYNLLSKNAVKVKENFSWFNFANKYFDIYKKTLLNL